MTQKTTTEQRRKFRTRNKVRANAVVTGRPRLSVHRTNNAIYAQIIDDRLGKTLASASTLDKDFKGNGDNMAAAQTVGKTVAERAKKAGIKAVIFDRGQYLYHGRVKALAEAARAGGLEF